MQKYLPLTLLAVIVLFFFKSFFLQGKLPIPADTIVGLYHPFRDLYVKEYPRGIPFKNFLITDPVRQQYPWRELSISIEKQLQPPLWNPYNMAGVPLLGNFQSAVFYPLNLFLFVLPFELGWSILIVLQPLLAAIFLYLYLNNLKLSKWASILGSLSFAFSGFFIAWLEWGTIIHTAVWLPLILLCIDKIFVCSKNDNSKLQFKIQNYVVWAIILVFSLTSSFFAGHLQTFFYLLIFSLTYVIVRWIQFGKKIPALLLFAICYLLFAIVTSVQWLPTFQFILESARDIDQVRWGEGGWFIPFQHLIQFVAPDFFGNPTTLNYWGVWNYGELVGYVGIVPLILALFAMFYRRNKKTLFFGTLLFLSLVFSLPTFLAKVPYLLKIPLISTTQPTRLLFLADFSLAVLTALGFDYLIKNKTWKIFYPAIFIGAIAAALWFFVLIGNKTFNLITIVDLSVAKHNLYLPTALFIAGIIAMLFYLKTSKPFTIAIIRIIIVGLVVFDLFRFGWKFTSFTNKEYLFPNTKTIEFLKKNIGLYRIMTEDSRILPSNFSAIYRIQSVDGYDPLYLRRYAELIAASERGKPDISTPLGFNRIITPNIYTSKIIDLLGVKYVLSLSDLDSPKLRKVFQEGQTQVYENKEVLPRTFFVQQVEIANSKNEAIKKMFQKEFNMGGMAVVEGMYTRLLPQVLSVGKAEIISYKPNKVIIKTENSGEGFLVLTDSFYPTWHARVDGAPTKIYRTDYNFRGIIVPKGKHIVEFYITLI